MTRRTTLYLLISAAAAALFVRLGIWQLSRLHERRALNAVVLARLAAPPASWRALPTDSGAVHYRRALVAGTYEFAREVVLANRQRDGSPGVNVVTPVRVAGTDTLVLVNRGWVYSPNGTAIDAARWREPDTTVVASGWVEIPSRRAGDAALASTARAYRWLDVDALAKSFGAPVTPYYVVLDPPRDSARRDVPVRLAAPALDEGPHKSYAVQWFSFASVAVVGAVVYARSQRRPG